MGMFSIIKCRGNKLILGGGDGDVQYYKIIQVPAEETLIRVPHFNKYFILSKYYTLL
jgi:hypothetical protein